MKDNKCQFRFYFVVKCEAESLMACPSLIYLLVNLTLIQNTCLDLIIKITWYLSYF